MRHRDSIWLLLPMEIRRNMVKRMQLMMFGSLAVTKNRIVMATFVEWIVANDSTLRRVHLMPA